MSVLSKIVRNTIGVVSPKYRTLSQWAVIYNNIVQTKTISSKRTPASLHEIRSLAERLYREQGINTMQLLGHTSQTMTDLYNRDRGLSSREGQWKTVVL